MQQAGSKNTSWFKARTLNMNFDLSKSDYKAIENIGTGAYGVVCSAIQVKTGKKFAIKKIPNAFEEIITAKRTFRELKILRHFDHENVIRIHEILMPRESLSEFKDVYVVMDLMESDLHQILYSSQPFTNEHTQYFLYQILRGLKYIHSANVVHRDLKPSNLLVNENCELKIGDFGMARGMSSKNSAKKNLFMTQYVATRWYRAPELLFSAFNYAQSVDMWSVGCILAEMISRKQLFPGKNPVDQLMLIINVLGMPPDSMLKSANSEQIVMFFQKRYGGRTPVGLANKVIEASPDGLALLSKMLVFDPDQRISIEDSLRDPFVVSYHDPDDEPICLPKFDFSFDDQPMTTDQIRQQVGKMILKYSRQKMSSLKLPSSAASMFAKPSFGELQSSTTPLPSSTTVPAGGKREMHDTLKDATHLEGGSNVVEAEKCDTVLSVGSFLKPATPPSLRQASSAGQVATDIEMKSARSACNDAVNSILSITAIPQKAADGKSDIEMASARRTDNDGNLEVPADVQMLSAKSEKGKNEDVRKDDGTGGVNQLVESQGLKVVDERKVSTEGGVGTDQHIIFKGLLGTGGEDTTALIKAVLKNTVLMKSKLKKEKQEMFSQDQRPIRKMSLAQSRQKEREEKRRQRHKRAKDKQKKTKASSKENESKGSLLTTEDRNLLEKWKVMQSNDSSNLKPKAVGNNSNQSQSTSAATQSQSTLTSVVNLAHAGSQPASQGVILTLGNSSVVTNVSQNLIFVPVATMPGHLPTSANNSGLSQTVTVLSSTSGNVNSSQALTYTSQSVNPPSMVSNNNTAPPDVPLGSLSSFRDSPRQTTSGGSSADGFTDITSLLLDSPDPQVSPTQCTDDVFLGAGVGEGRPIRPHFRGDYRSAYHGSPSPPSFLSGSFSDRLPAYQGGPIKVAPSPPDMNAISDQLARSAVLDDPFPYLQLTPRGDGSGYGLGVNLEDFLCHIPESEERDGDDDSNKSSAEAQLSASVLSGILREHDLNPDDLQAIHRELGLTSPISLDNLSQLSPTTETAAASP